MRVTTASAGFITLGLFLVGCGGEEEPDAAEPSSSQSETEPDDEGSPTPAESPNPVEPSNTLSEDEPGDEGLAIWEASNPQAVNTEADTVEIGVSRLACANGETGEIVDIDIDPGDDQVVIEATVEPRVGEASCPANEIVPADIELDEPIGDRELVDGACEHERAAATTFCDTPVRWSPGAN